MRTETHHPTVTLWFADRVPSRMVWAGRRWSVTDTPTPLNGASTNKPEDRGWRFQGREPDGLSIVFDVYLHDGDWHVHKQYE